MAPNLSAITQNENLKGSIHSGSISIVYIIAQLQFSAHVVKEKWKRTIMDYFNSEWCSVVLKLGKRGEEGAIACMSFSNALTL